MEVWRDIIGFEGVYEASNTGFIRRVETKRCLSPGDNGRGYLFVNLSMHNKQYRKYVHRIVAETFISNENNKPTINHKDGNRANNNVENLEWSTYLENNIHSIKTLHRDSKNSSDSKPVLQFDLEGHLIKEYPSMREAQRQTGIVGIDKVCLGIKYRKTAGGFVWRYKI